MLAAQVSPHLHRSFRWDDGDRRRFPPLHKEKVLPSSCRCFESRSRSLAGGLRCGFDPQRLRCVVRASLAEPLSKVAESVRGGSSESGEVLFEETITLNRLHKVEGKVSVRMDPEKLIIGCNLEGNWVLHWGVTYYDDIDSEWDMPPDNMAPAGSTPIKDYAMETPMKKSSPDLVGNTLNEVKINLDLNSPVATIHFVLKEEESGKWYRNQERDFTVHLSDLSRKDCASKSGQKHINIWQGASAEIPNFLIESDGCHGKNETDAAEVCKNKCLEGFYEEYTIVKEETVKNSAKISITRSARKHKRFLHFDTDVPGKVTLHWGVCKDETKRWAVPAAPFPPQSRVFRNKALQTTLQQKSGSVGSWGVFQLGKGVQGVLFVLKIDDNVWLSDMGNDYYVPLAIENGAPFPSIVESSEATTIHPEEKEEPASTDEIINEIRNLVTDISAEKKMITTSKEAQESILQEIEKLAAEAYSIFRSSTPGFIEDLVSESELAQPSIRIASGAGTGYEILCQGFNWESHRSGRWYTDLRDKASDLYDFGVTAVWLPPPTESISPQGYMPKDLYDLNSSYGSVDDLKNLINRLHEFDIKVVGDVVLNHRCAHFQNGNGIWNIFGGQLNWDDRAVVSDDPHFQGRGNKSSGEQFHAAPNIDHSQEFVRNDLKEWLCWLRNEIGYDGWRLDFVRGFWGGYIKDYMEASKPYFAVGEFWDSLSYTYGKIDHNQDAHRQRIIDWINTTNGTSGAFDITTKGILHAVMDNCEYWRLSDEKGKPPGVIGWWPSRAVTFIENHDTGSTQGHWRFPGGKEMQGYAYILTHPGTPTVFYDHVFSHLQQEIANLISIRRRLDINCRSLVRIRKAEGDVYAAEIDEKAIVKIGPGHYEPNDGSRRWRLCAEGRDYKIWESA